MPSCGQSAAEQTNAPHGGSSSAKLTCQPSHVSFVKKMCIKSLLSRPSLLASGKRWDCWAITGRCTPGAAFFCLLFPPSNRVLSSTVSPERARHARVAGTLGCIAPGPELRVAHLSTARTGWMQQGRSATAYNSSHRCGSGREPANCLARLVIRFLCSVLFADRPTRHGVEPTVCAHALRPSQMVLFTAEQTNGIYMCCLVMLCCYLLN